MGSPTVGLLVMTRNGGELACRAIDSLASGVDELVLVDTGSSDDTVGKVTDHWYTIKDKKSVVVYYTPETHPMGYLLDSPEEFRDETGQCRLPGPFTGKPFLADFGAARQRGWDLLATDYKVFLDTDDVWTPEKPGEDCGALLREAVAAMEQADMEVGLVPHDHRADENGDPACELLRERVVRRTADWQGRMHERLVGQRTDEKARGYLRGFGRTIDLHDHVDPGSRVAYRELKVLLYDYYRGDRTLRTLYSLAMEARLVRPPLSIELFLRVARQTDWPEQRAKSYYEAGLVHENAYKDYRQAWEMHQLSLASGVRLPEAVFALARLAMLNGDAQDCVNLTRTGFDLMRDARETVLQHNPMARDAWPTYVHASALAKLGKVEEARREVAALVLRHPRVTEFSELASALAAG